MRRARGAAIGAATWLCAIGAAAMAAAPAAAAQQAGTRAPRPAPASAPRAATQAAATAQAATAQAELESLRAALGENERRLLALAGSLSGRPVSSAVLDSLSRLQREREALLRRARTLEARLRFRETEVAMRREASGTGPQGWFGVNVTTTGGAGVTADGRVLVTTDYPVVASVEPGSPAARAGVQAGDRLITILGRDLRSEQFDLSRVLRPGTTVPVRIVRDGRPLDVALAITARPTSFGPSRITVDIAESVPRSASRAPRPPRAVVERVRVRGGAPAAEAGARTIPRPQSYLFTRGTGVAPVAGAEVMALTDGLRSTFELERGLFVVSVLPRTPADAAGLRVGDVLLRADGALLGEPLDLLKVVQRETGGDRRLLIELVREKRERKVEMRW